MTDVFMIVGKIGTGGMTTAMFNRAAMLNGAGHRCRIVSLEYRPDLEVFIQSLREQGRLDPTVEILNPYRPSGVVGAPDLQTDESQTRASTGPQEPGFFVQDDDFVSQRYARYFDVDGSYIKFKRWGPDGLLRHVDYFDDERVRICREEFDRHGKRHYARNFRDGSLHQERYFDKDGFCYLVRWTDPVSGRQQGVYELDRHSTHVRRHSDNAAWHSAWLTRLARACDQKPVLIADGPRSVPKVMAVDPEAAARVGVVHTNHYVNDARTQIKQDHVPFLSRIQNLDALLVLTQEQADDIAEQFGHAEKIYVMPNSIAAYDRPDVERVPGRVSAFVKLISKKGVAHLIMAFKHVAEELPQARLDIYGEGPQRQQFQDLIEEAGLTGVVTLRGYTTTPALEIARSSCTVLSSEAEGLPYVIMESMLVATPVVSYDCKYGPRDLIDDGDDSILVPHGDVAQLGKQITRLLQQPDELAAMGQRARAKILARYTPATLVHKWESLFAEVAG